jgi:hypothetical protein
LPCFFRIFMSCQLSNIKRSGRTLFPGMLNRDLVVRPQPLSPFCNTL